MKSSDNLPPRVMYQPEFTYNRDRFKDGKPILYFGPDQVSLLRTLARQGMTAVVMNTWEPYPKELQAGYSGDAWNKRKLKYGSDNEFSKSDRKFKEWLIYDKRFTNDHSLTVQYLIKYKSFSPIDAIAAVSGISGKEAALIRNFFFDAGLDKTFIIENRNNYCFKAEIFHEALIYFVTREIPLMKALEELKNLTAAHIGVLVDLYPYQLRGDDLRRGDVTQVCVAYEELRSRNAADAIGYFIGIYRRAIQANELPHGALLILFNEVLAWGPYRLCTCSHYSGLSKEFKFLYKFAGDGIRMQDVQIIFSKQGAVAQKTITYLRYFQRLTIHQALAEVDGLDENQLIFLKKHYREGLRNHHLKQAVNIGMEEVEFLMQKLGLPLVETLEKTHDLNKMQINLLCQFTHLGLTISEAKSLNFDKPLEPLKIEAAQHLVLHRHYLARDALLAVYEKTDTQLLEIIKDNSSTVSFSLKK